MSDDATRDDLPVIAIGASAGGLEACRALFKDLPGQTQAALILILHLDPTHDSLMVDLLAAHTDLKVVQASDGMALRPGCLYVIPPGVFLTVTRRVLHLSEPRGGKAVRFPFDVLLKSLAEDAAALSAGVVLSGTGTDGSRGIVDIDAAGGLVIAQDPEEAGYPGMPESAIGTGVVAKILPTAQMVAALAAFIADMPKEAAKKPAQVAHDKAGVPRAETPGTRGYDDILAFVREHTAQDISLYKRGTLERRIARRMATLGLDPDETGRYLTMLQSDTEERAHLSADLLIHVTSFFRDPEVFRHLSAKVIPDLLSDLPDDRPLRIWVAGCSTGEEAY